MEQAMDALAEALTLAEPGGYVRIFLDEGPAMARLLRQAASRGVAPPTWQSCWRHLTDRVQDAGRTPTARPQPLIEPLSEREMEVLRLLARGMSNPRSPSSSMSP